MYSHNDLNSQPLTVDATAVINGDMMAPELRDGDLAFVQFSTPGNGELAFVDFYGEYTVKRVSYLPGGFVLTSNAASCQPITVSGAMLQDVHIIGKISGCVRLINAHSACESDVPISAV